MQPLTHDELLALPAVVDIETAARAIGIGRTKAYALARTGDFPCSTLHLGRCYRVLTEELLTLLKITSREH